MNKKTWLLRDPDFIPKNKNVRLLLFCIINILFVVLYPTLAIFVIYPYGFLCWILVGSFMFLFNNKAFHIHVERYPLNDYEEYRFNVLKDQIKSNNQIFYIYLYKESKGKYLAKLEDKKLVFDMKGCICPLTVIRAYFVRQFSIAYINKYRMNSDYMGKNIYISKLFKEMKNVYLQFEKKGKIKMMSLIKSYKTRMNMIEKSINGYGYVFWYSSYHGTNRYYVKISEKDFAERKIK